MNDEIKEQLNRIEQYAKIAAKSMLTIKEASFILGLSEQSVRNKARNREIACYKPNHNTLYFAKSDLETWMRQNRSKSQAELESEGIVYCLTHKKGK